MHSWVLLKKQGEEFFKIQDYQKACDLYKDALTEVESIFNESKLELKDEAAKVSLNVSLMYLKLFKERNDDSLLHESKIYAKKSIFYNPKWIKGYLRLNEACKSNKDLKDILNAITLYLQDNKVLTDDFKSLLKEVKYYTHKSIMMLSPSWHLVQYKTNVYVIDILGAGHFEDFKEFMNCHGKCIENISLLVRPGTYVGTYFLTNANIDIVGDCDIEINSSTKAIDKDPTVIFTNTLDGIKNTFEFLICKVSMKRLSVYGEIVHAVACKVTDIKLTECCFVSKKNTSLCAVGSSKLYCKRCRSVGGYNGVVTGKNTSANLTDCFISEMNGNGIKATDETEMISLKHCTVTKCQQQGLFVFYGAKKAKVQNSRFEGNCPFEIGMASIQVKNCRLLVKNTYVGHYGKSVGIAIEGGCGIFDNVIIENCDIGIMVQAKLELKNCFLYSCYYGIQVDKVEKGIVVLENNTITKCSGEIAVIGDTTFPTFKGEKKHNIILFPSFHDDQMKAKIDGSNDTYNKVCDHCSLQFQNSSKTLKACSACKMRYYCSSKCQQKEWKLHKINCARYVKAKKVIKKTQQYVNENKDSNNYIEPSHITRCDKIVTATEEVMEVKPVILLVVVMILSMLLVIYSIISN